MAGNKHWTETETEYLRTHYPAISAERLREILPDRSARAIRAHAQQWGRLINDQDVDKVMGEMENVLKRWEGKRKGEMQA